MQARRLPCPEKNNEQHDRDRKRQPPGTAPVPSAEPFLRLEAIHKQFGPYPVLHDVCFEMAKGEVVAIIGPSGSGKSTLLRCINQLEPATRGRVSMGGVAIEAGRPLPRSELLNLRRRIGMVFQSFNLFPHLTVLRNVSLAQVRTLGRSAEEADARSLQLLDRVGLADKANAYPARCSGGQQQRIAIARALALDPELMLFDEPTSALDPELGLEVLAVMKELAREGMSMLVVTHEMHFAETVSDRVVVMAEGRIIEQGPSAQVMREPQHARVAQFLQAVRNR
ncbi:amino acid ABC transporter ATP-binding protein [Pseudomonas protegens]|nr:amino acid ABC transporter ATP-binding protein [Pseudomonas protegens]